MYITVRQKKKISLFLFGMVVILLVSFLFVWRTFFDLEPRDVVLSNVGEDGVTVTWVTDMKVNGSLILYQDGEKIRTYRDSRGVGRSHTHHVDIDGLNPDTSYEFEITPVGVLKSGVNMTYEFKTSKVIAERPIPDILTGFVESDSSDVLALLLVDDVDKGFPLSTHVSPNGQWSFNLSVLSLDRSAFLDIRNDTPLKLLFYNNDGVKVLQGNKNVLFSRDGELKETVRLDGSEDVFSHIPNFARFRDSVTDFENIAIEPERDDETRHVLGVEEEIDVEEVFDEKEEEKEQVVEEIEKEDFLRRLDDLSDYGFR